MTNRKTGGKTRTSGKTRGGKKDRNSGGRTGRIKSEKIDRKTSKRADGRRILNV